MSQQNPTPNTPGPGGGQPIQEEVLFEGSPAWVGRLKAFALTWAIALLLVVVPITLMIYGVKPPWWVTVLAIVIAIVLVFAQTLYHRSMRYRVTNYRIDFERGTITRRIDSIELWHAHDIFFRQTLLERMMNAGSIDIISDDSTTPKLELHAVPGGRVLFERIKTCILNAKRQRGMLELDRGIPGT